MTMQTAPRSAGNNTGGPSRGRILVVDDDAGIRALLSRYLEMEGYEVVTANNGKTALEAIATQAPDLMLLDVMLQPDDGLEVLAKIRERSDIAVILVTGLGTEADRVLGLKLGADDYIVKPFSAAELEARVASVLRRSRPATAATLSYEGLLINLGTREVTVDGNPVTLTAKEFDLLAFLASSPRQVFSREQLLDHVWHSSSDWQSADTVTEHVRRLRKRLEADPDHPRWIATVRGVGYRFIP